jgi:prolyl-tRNA editing enzyme YbaK/EbsC (Cys-tRNA(Pro) deacylase)
VSGSAGRDPDAEARERGRESSTTSGADASRPRDTSEGRIPDATALSASARKVQDAIAALGFGNQVIELPIPVRTAADAAGAVGCEVAQIAKSVIFRGVTSGRPVLVVTSGAHRVDEAKVAALIGEAIGRADPDFVRASTGFAIGGIPPVGHATPPITLVDEHLLTLAELWAAAGHPNSLFRLTPDELVRMTGGRVARVS